MRERKANRPLLDIRSADIGSDSVPLGSGSLLVDGRRELSTEELEIVEEDWAIDAARLR